MDEKYLVQASQDGDSSSFERLVEKYQSMVCAITFSATGRVDVSEEMAQETFLRAWKNIVQLKELDRFRYWLCGISRNLIKDYYQKKQTEKIIFCDSETLTELSSSAESTPSEALISQEEQMILSQAILRMPEEYREPLVLFYRQGQSVKEVSETLELNEATVRTRLLRGRQMLKDEVAAMVERTLEKTGPSKAFTGAVMVAIGGLAAGTAATAAAMGISSGASTSAAGGASATAATTGLFTAAGVKVAAIATAVIIGAGVVVYSLNAPNPPVKSTVVDATFKPKPKVISTDSNSKTAPAAVADTNTAQIASQNTAPQLTPQLVTQSSVRHPDWPGINEPVENFCFTSKAHIVGISDNQTGPAIPPAASTEDTSQKLWIKLPRQYRQEDSKMIYLDNGRERIHVDKLKKTVQRSYSKTAGDIPVFAGAQEPLHVQGPLKEYEFIRTAKLFRHAKNPVNEPNSISEYEFKQIGSQDNDTILIYQLIPLSALNCDIKAYVDAATLLPEKIVVAYTDPNKPDFNCPEEYQFDFSPIPDSLFTYQLQPSETQLAYKEPSGFYGHVVDLMNNSVAGAEVYINYFPSPDDSMKATTDKAGRFEIKIPDKFPHNIQAVHLPIYFWAILPGRQDFSAWTVLYQPDIHEVYDPNLIPGFGGNIVSQREVSTGTRTENGITSTYQTYSPILQDPIIKDIVLVMQPTGTITGYVTDNAGNGIHDAKLECKYQFGSEPEKSIPFLIGDNFKWKFSATSDSNGYYIIKGLPSLWKYCRFTMTVSVPGYVGESKEIVLDEPLVKKEWNIKLHSQQVTVRGVLKDNYGVPLEKRSIRVLAPNISILECSAETDPNGYFMITGCPDVPGLKLHTYLSQNNNPFTMELNGKLIEKEKYLSFRYYPDVKAKIAYVAGQKDYYAELTAIRPELELEITVIDSEGYPVPDLKVQLDGKTERNMSTERDYGFWSQEKLQKRTDDDGVVKFDNIPDLKELKIRLMPAIPFIRHGQMLGANFEEHKRLEKIDKEYKDLYHSMELPVLLEPGQKKYKMTIPILTEEEYKQQANPNQ